MISTALVPVQAALFACMSGRKVVWIEALKDFEDVLSTPEKNVCTEKMTKHIRSYYKKYLDTSRGRLSRTNLPKSLKHLVVA